MNEKVKYNYIFSELAQIWLEGLSAIIKESSYVKYGNLLRLYIIPYIGEYYISEITDDVVYEMGCNLLKYGGVNQNGLKPKTVLDIISVLMNIRKFAISRNIPIYFSSVNLPIRKNKKQLEVLTLSEQQTLYNYLVNNLSLSNLGILTCLFTGIRIGEICALKWEDISITEKTVNVHSTMQRLQIINGNERKTKVTISSPKSSCSIRTIPIPDIVMQKILEQKQSLNTYFLTGSCEKYVEPRTMQNRFKNVLKECGLKETNFHILRHTFATRCIEVGFDVKSLSEILGHANVNITLDRYVHPTMELKRDNMSKLSSLFSKD